MFASGINRECRLLEWVNRQTKFPTLSLSLSLSLFLSLSFPISLFISLYSASDSRPSSRRSPLRWYRILAAIVRICYRNIFLRETFILTPSSVKLYLHCINKLFSQYGKYSFQLYFSLLSVSYIFPYTRKKNRSKLGLTRGSI